MQDQANLSSELTGSDSGGLQPPSPLMEGASIDELRTELAKWQARVPKLAAALRQRTDELEGVKAELRTRIDAPIGRHEQGTGIEARNALIEELESKVRALNSKHQDSEGQLHARDLEIASLREEAGEWREKWQSATGSLDEQADSGKLKEAELKRVREEFDEMVALQDHQSAKVREQELELTELRQSSSSLVARNEKLFETTELANRQIETLGDNLQHLRTQLKEKNSESAESDTRTEEAAKELEAVKAQVSTRDQDIEFLHGHVEEKQTEISKLTEKTGELEELLAAGAEAGKQLDSLNRTLEERDQELASLADRLVDFDAAKDRLKAVESTMADKENELSQQQDETRRSENLLAEREADLASQKQEVERLEECVAQADESNGRWEVERRQLSEQMDELKKRNQHLESQLEERSDLVVGLEQEKSAISDHTSSLESENTRLSEALEKAQRSLADNADHIAQVDSRLDRQKQLMENVEQEFAQVQEEYAHAVQAHGHEMSEKDTRIEALNEQIAEDATDILKAQLNELETSLTGARKSLEDAEAEARQNEEKSVDLGRELDQRKSQDDAARQLLSEKVEKLEKQLRKQSTATATAEEALAEARTEAQEQRSQASLTPDEVSSENLVLQQEVVKLEGMVRERTEQLNKSRWQQDMIEKQGAEGDDSKMLVVLNQQLIGAREDNQRLRDRVKELESRPKAPQPLDDLAKIRGIGPKLVVQLAELGIDQFDQIATLSEADLDDEDHVLHSMKGRILKDGWIGQAAKLGGGA